MSIKRRTILTRNMLCFMETAKIGTVSGTAEANNMKQSNVSTCIKEFENQIASYVGAKYAVAVSNGTAALHIAYMALGLKPKDKIITTPITFAATANAALYIGAKPIFVDVLPDTPLIDPKKIEGKITSAVKIIAPVHYGGMVADMVKIKEIAKKHNQFVVEDACHALGSRGDGWSVGSCKHSDMTVFSFHPVKHITTGEGGVITTNNKTLYEKLLILRNHGIIRENFVRTPDNPRYYEMVELGYNYRITDIQAALGISQLKKLDKFIEKRCQIASFYNENIKKMKKITVPVEPKNIFNAYHLYPTLFNSSEMRDKVYHKLAAQGIQCQIHYTPVYRHPYYQNNGYKKTKCPNGENFYKRMLSLPMYPKMTMDDAEYVIKNLKKVTE